GHLIEMRHYLFNGKLPKDENGLFRVLIAGGGTGDALIMLAQQLADAEIEADIHYIDLSSSSREIAEKRAKIRNLSNITFHTGSLLEADKLGLFHYIDSCGVLHHLPDPSKGFSTLAKMLHPEGGMGIMVYGTYGRTGVYHMQEALRIVAAEGSSQERVDHTKALIDRLPSTNWLMNNPTIRDHKISDSGIFDLLLHSQDRAYTIPELEEELSGAGLEFVSLIDPVQYEPDYYNLPETTSHALKEKGKWVRASFCELIAGNMHKHIFYARADANSASKTASISNMSMIPVFRDAETANQLRQLPMGAQPSFVMNGLRFEPNIHPQAGAILRLIDGKSTLDEIRRRLPSQPDPIVFGGFFTPIFKVFNDFGKLFLKQ
ncbi:MAG: class I SAM-dependent methyltransferase, partial [Alphaproteobacteria bacterium]|nr:class I SAM-dependent methyltransferase [Alphaproteobacteria bacterium]